MTGRIRTRLAALALTLFTVFAAGCGSGMEPEDRGHTASLRFSIESAGHVRLTVVDVQGVVMAVLVDGIVEAGEHQYVFDSGPLSAGVYWAVFESAGTVWSRKLILPD